MDLTTLRKFMFLHDYIPSLVQNPTEVKKNSVEETLGSQDLFIPKYKDTLFWCFYIIHYGWQEFFFIQKNHFKIEKETKINIIEKLRLQKKINSLENDLLNNKIISLSTFLHLCAFFSINVIVIHDHFYYKNISNETDTIFYLRKYKHRFGIDSRKKVHKIINGFLALENIKKPIPPFYKLKVNDIKTMCHKLNLSIKGNKRELYNAIKIKINEN